MIAVIFEVVPAPGRKQEYLDLAAELRPALEKIDGFISIDGAEPDRITYLATGSHRYRIKFKGPGGHSFGAFGLPSAIHAKAQSGSTHQAPLSFSRHEYGVLMANQQAPKY